MDFRLHCTPDGRLAVRPATPGETADPLSVPDPSLPRNAAEAMLLLARRTPQNIPSDAGLAWLQRFSHWWLAAVCRARSPAPRIPVSSAASPDKKPGLLSGLDSWLETAPFFPGSEYLAVTSLSTLWQDAGAALEEICTAAPGGLEAWISSGQCPWHLIGRVVLHLAENKRDPEKPFAFLATWTESLGATGTPRHVPLGRAIQAGINTRDSPALESLLAPLREAAAASAWAQEMLGTRRFFQPLAWTPREAWTFLREIPLLEQAGLTVRIPDWWHGGRPARPRVQVTLAMAGPTASSPAADSTRAALGASALLRCHITATLDGTPLTGEEWARIRQSPAGLINLRGRWTEVDPVRLSQVLEHWEKVAAAAEHHGLGFHEGMRFLAGCPADNSRPGSAPPPEDWLRDWSSVQAGQDLAALLREMRCPPARTGLCPGIRATLRPYQETGVAWLTFMRRLGLGACLADDMGLGKTLQVITLLATAAPEKTAPANPEPPVLLVVPASLLGNWRSEFHQFAPWLRLFTAHASHTSRSELRTALENPARAFGSFHAVLTTYGQLQRSSALQRHRWGALILDEAQAIRNPASAQTRAVKKTSAAWRLALTGTPVENRPSDLWSLFDFLNPGLLGTAAAFESAVQRMTPSSTGFAPLRRLVHPYLLRRMKTDPAIASGLPDKTEILTVCGLSRKQAVLYGRLAARLEKALRDPATGPLERRTLVASCLMQFKQVCNHPSHWAGDGGYAPADSGKFQRLAELCNGIAERQERVLIFTQFREIMEPLHAFLTDIFKRPGLLLHGGIPVGVRQELVDRFQSPDGPPFFLLSVRAGGTGLNLTAAPHVIHFDRWWNPAVENQATDRAHRLGQRQPVLVHKFVTAGTLEERIDALIESKKSLARDFLETGSEGAAPDLTSLSDQELLDFIALDASAALGED